MGRNNIIFYRKNFVELVFPYNPEIISFIKREFVFPKFQPGSKSWYVPIYLQREREALERLKEQFGFRDWYEFEPEESSGWKIDRQRGDLVLKFISPNFGELFNRLIFPYEDLDLLKEIKNEGERIKKLAYYRKENRETVWSLSDRVLRFFLQRGIDNLFVQTQLKPFMEKFWLEQTLGSLVKPVGEFKGFNYLFPFQKAGLQVLARRLKKYKGQILGDEMGLGKTIQAGALIKGLKLYPALVITPASLKYSFANKLEEVVKIPNIKVLNGSRPYSIPQGEVVIINYDVLSYWKDKLAEFPFKLIVGDEAHYLKNPQAKRTRAFKQIAKEIPYKLLMTGTPWQKSPDELWSLLEISGLAKFITPTKREFEDRFVHYEVREIRSKGIKVKVPLGVKDAEGLRAKLFAIALVRRTKEQVLKDLPPKLVSKEVVELTNRSEYDYYIENKFDTEFLLEYAERKGVELPPDIFSWERREQFEWVLKNRPSIFMELHGELYKLLGEGKVKPVVEFVKNYFENNPDGKVVVFAYHRSVQDKLVKELKNFNPLHLKGEMGAKMKAEIEKIFNEDDTNKVLVASLMAGKEGLTLTRADTLIFSEMWFNPQDLAQAEDRIHRIGQDKTAKIYYFIAKDTIDEDIWNIVKERQRSFNRVFSASEKLKREGKKMKLF